FLAWFLENYYRLDQMQVSDWCQPRRSRGVETGPGWGWAAFLLGDLEQDNLQRQTDFNGSLRSSAHAAVRAQGLAVFRCPSDQYAERFRVCSESGQRLADVAQANDEAQRRRPR